MPGRRDDGNPTWLRRSRLRRARFHADDLSCAGADGAGNAEAVARTHASGAGRALRTREAVEGRGVGAEGRAVRPDEARAPLARIATEGRLPADLASIDVGRARALPWRCAALLVAARSPAHAGAALVAVGAWLPILLASGHRLLPGTGNGEQADQRRAGEPEDTASRAWASG
jgi:hypothetical protein